jgi:hypothetical protein
LSQQYYDDPAANSQSALVHQFAPQPHSFASPLRPHPSSYWADPQFTLLASDTSEAASAPSHPSTNASLTTGEGLLNFGADWNDGDWPVPILRDPSAWDTGNCQTIAPTLGEPWTPAHGVSFQMYPIHLTSTDASFSANDFRSSHSSTAFPNAHIDFGQHSTTPDSIDMPWSRILMFQSASPTSPSAAALVDLGSSSPTSSDHMSSSGAPQPPLPLPASITQRCPRCSELFGTKKSYR